MYLGLAGVARWTDRRPGTKLSVAIRRIYKGRSTPAGLHTHAADNESREEA
jgi:hypothetical protein